MKPVASFLLRPQAILYVYDNIDSPPSPLCITALPLHVWFKEVAQIIPYFAEKL